MHPRSLNAKTQHEVRLGLSPPQSRQAQALNCAEGGGHRITNSPADG